MLLETFVFYNGLSEKSRGYPYLIRYGSVIDKLALFEVAITAGGDLAYEGLSRNLIREAHQLGLKVIMVISNLSGGQFSTQIIGQLIHNRSFANRVWRKIYQILRDYQFDGINFDFERASPRERMPFTQFINTWANQFKQLNFLVSVDIPAKTYDDRANEWSGAFDYRLISQAADALILMTYEEHWASSEPGSVASLPWVSGVLDYAISQMPKDKIFLGIPLYGYDWVQNGRGKAIRYEKAIETARRFGTPIRWDERQHSSYYVYTSGRERHMVYFEDPRSITEKIRLAKTKGIKGIALWEMNLSNPDLWETIKKEI